jgi:predicted RNA-binding protein YlqC (UPF0109 family)
MNEVEYLASIVKPLVSEVDSVRINRIVDERGVLLELTVAKRDMGIVIGKEGAMAKSLRHLVSTYGFLHNARVSVKINEPITQ